jgi:hypothetical protein
MRKMSATFMAGSNVHELSKPLSYRGLCSYDATYMVRNFNFVALVDPVHLRGQIKEDRMVNLTAHPLGPQPKVPTSPKMLTLKGMSTFETDKHLQQALM